MEKIECEYCKKKMRKAEFGIHVCPDMVYALKLGKEESKE